VGVAKTGTTYLQRLLFRNSELLADNGVLIPGEDPSAHFYASLDLRGETYLGHVHLDVPGAWARLVDEVDGHAGDAAVISHESFARCDDALVKQVATAFRTDDVRVLLTARDLGRQLPAVWQEQVKNQSTQPYGAFLRQVLERWSRGRFDGEFWTPQWLPGVVDRWAAAAGAEHVTIVTVPPSGASPHELWRRCSLALGLPDAPYDLDLPDRNLSLGRAEAELLRRLNKRLGRLPWPRYEEAVKQRFAEGRLAQMNKSAPTSVPSKWRDRVQEISDSVVDQLQVSRVRVVGDLDELRPRFDERPSKTRATEAELLAVAIRLLEAYVTDPEPSPPSRPEPTVPALVRRRLRLRTRANRLWSAVRRG
jgi:hypothetical protein